MRDYKPIYVAKDEFNNFLSSYPKRLESNVCGIFEPPLLTYNDFCLGKKWPESVVASASSSEYNESYSVSKFNKVGVRRHRFSEIEKNISSKGREVAKDEFDKFVDNDKLVVIKVINHDGVTLVTYNCFNGKPFPECVSAYTYDYDENVKEEERVYRVI